MVSFFLKHEKISDHQNLDIRKKSTISKISPPNVFCKFSVPKNLAQSSEAINKQELDSLRTKKNELTGFRYSQNKQLIEINKISS